MTQAATRTRQVVATNHFRKDFEKYSRYSAKDIPATLNEFLRQKMVSSEPFVGGEDSSLQPVIKGGVMGVHLHYGKVVVIYKLTDGLVVLYRMVEGNELRNSKTTMDHARYVYSRKPSDFSVWKVEQAQTSNVEPRIGDMEFLTLQELIGSMVYREDEKEQLRQYASNGTGEFAEVLRQFAQEVIPGVDAATAEQKLLQAWQAKFKVPLTTFIAQMIGR